MLYRCVTNNPAITNGKFKRLIIDYYDIGILELFYKVNEEIDRGYILITHPLSSNLSPDVSPYKSVILSKGTASQLAQSKSIISKSIVYSKSLLVENRMRKWSIDELLDFQFVDESILSNLELT